VSPTPQPHSPREPIGTGQPLETAILFIDLVNSSDFATVLGLREYAAYVDAFEELCQRQCEHFFKTYHEGEYQPGKNYSWEFSGDELVVFMHTDRPANDVYQLVCLAITLKCGWLGAAPNAERIASGVPAADLGAGVHIGTVWATPRGNGYRLRGAAISTGKRIETASRGGDRFRIYVSDPAFKRISRKTKNLLFSPRHVPSMRGIVLPVAVREVHDSFMDLSQRLAPEHAVSFRDVATRALHSATFDAWIHSCLQVWDERANGRVTDECMEMCKTLLTVDPTNAVALYHAAQGARERDDLETAKLYLEELTTCSPRFGDGWLELGRLCKQTGSLAEARKAIIQARRHGVSVEEESVPEAGPL